MAGREIKTRFRWRDGTVFCQRGGGAIRTDVIDGDKTIKYNRRHFLGWAGRCKSKVGEIVDGTGPRYHFHDGFTAPSRPERYRSVKISVKPCGLDRKSVV